MRKVRRVMQTEEMKTNDKTKVFNFYKYRSMLVNSHLLAVFECADIAITILFIILA